MKHNYRTEMSRCNNWISTQFRDGYTWEEIENLCVPLDESAKRFCELQSIGIIPIDFLFPNGSSTYIRAGRSVRPAHWLPYLIGSRKIGTH